MARATASGDLPESRSLRLRRVLGSRLSKFNSAIPEHILVHAFQSFGQGRQPQLWERSPDSGHVERPITSVWHRTNALGADDRNLIVAQTHHLLGDGTKGMDGAGRNVQRARRPMQDHLGNDLPYLLDKDVISLLLALAKQHDLPSGRRTTAELIGTIAVMWIGRSIDQGRSEERRVGKE